MILGGLPAEIINAAENKQVSIAISEVIVEEIKHTLQYGRLSKIYELAGVSRQQLMGSVLKIGKLVSITSNASNVEIIKEDPSDDKIIQCAIASEADFIVSGDKHLAEKEIGKTRILSVGEFMRILKSTDE